MKPITRRCFPQSMTSFVGTLLSLFACSFALLISSADQTGTNLMELSRSFQGALTNLGTGRNEVGWTGSSDKSSTPLPFRCRDLKHRNEMSAAGGRVSSERTAGFTDKNRPDPREDTHTQMYLNLLSELQRFCSVSPVDLCDGELAIDFFSSVKTDEQLTSRICEVIQLLENKPAGLIHEYQLTLWAPSPGRAALVRTALRAAELQAGVEQHDAIQSLDSIRMSSSGQVWSFSDAVRPVVTIVIRRIGPEGGRQVSPERSGL